MLQRKQTNRWFQLFLIATGGAIIYLLPYLRYYYYDVMKEAFRVDDVQLGNMMSTFGLFMIVFYFPGGWISDRFSNRTIMCTGQILTGLAGLYFATFPPYPISLVISVFWSATTAMLFWTCMVGITRSLGNDKEQGRLFGLLEGARGLISTLFGLAVVPVFSSMGSGVEGLRTVIIIYAVSGILCGVISFFFLQDPPRAPKVEGAPKAKGGSFTQALKNPAVWMITLIFFAIMNLYVCLSYTTPYLTDVMHVADETAASIGVVRTWGLAMFGGVLGGFIADKISTTLTLIFSFLLVAIGFGAMLIIPADASYLIPTVVAFMAFGLGVFINRGIYFATMSEAKVPLALTGAAAALITAIGGSPEAFLYTLIGGWLKSMPGQQGYFMVFYYAIGSAILGMVVSFIMRRMVKKAQTVSK